MLLIQYTICRSGSYCYNRRVPKHAVQYYGQFIRCILSTDIHEAKDARLRDILTNYRLLHIHPFNDRHLLNRLSEILLNL